VSVKHNGDLRPYACPTCEKTFKSTNVLKEHLQIHVTDRALKCDVCGSKFKSKLHLRSHFNFNYNHGKGSVKKYKCEWESCGYACRTKENLKKYTVVHVHSGERPYQCLICSKSLATRGGLNLHSQVVHASEKKYSCSICEFATSDKLALKIHVRRIHTMERPYSCSLCDEKFYDTASRNSHFQRKQTVRSHSCVICSKKFVTRRELNVHSRRHNEDRVTFECSFCEKRFLRKRGQKNIRGHIQERSYVCGLCGFSSTTAQRLNSHMRVHRRITEANYCRNYSS
jgi:KRAB domain-containing zinc finger protein